MKERERGNQMTFDGLDGAPPDDDLRELTRFIEERQLREQRKTRSSGDWCVEGRRESV